jgi:hypothetical protein
VSSPKPLRDWVHPLIRFTFSSEYISAPDPLPLFPPAVPSVRFRPPSRHQLDESTCNEQIPSPSSSTLSVPPAHDGLLLFEPFGLISSQSHVRDSPFRGFPRRSAVRTSSMRRSLLPLARSSYCQVAPTAPVLLAPTTGLCSKRRSVAPTEVFSFDHARSPLRLRTPSG